MLDADDQDHAPCSELLRSWTGIRLVPAPVLVELDHFVPYGAFTSFLEDVQRGAFLIEDLQPGDYVRLRELLIAYADLRLGFVDAAVLAVVERFAERQVATLDRRHFAVVRLDHTDTLQLLPAGE
ncbi:MAG: VapC toxin family PIN domain ribonuclease [Actinomycetota bacterium]|nr:VapC toxin family PIN domain ribonuclease [Actinomycetota bacterium]